MTNHDGFFTYLVGWDDERVIKVGITTQPRRWRTFVTRGARLYQLYRTFDFYDGRGFYLLEQEMHAYLRATLVRAFATRADATPLLSNRGGGWLECHRADSPDAYRDALASCIRIMHSHGSEQCAEDMRGLMHGRTDGRTYVDPHFRRAHISPSQRAQGGRGR